jgi:hypothetical protein
VRSYICSGCERTIIVGHPVSLFRRQAHTLAKDTYSLLELLLRRRKILHKLVAAMEERFYLEPFHFRTMPSACPSCGRRGNPDLPWWRPGLAYRE